jgi:hypothetical protein
METSGNRPRRDLAGFPRGAWDREGTITANNEEIFRIPTRSVGTRGNRSRRDLAGFPRGAWEREGQATALRHWILISPHSHAERGNEGESIMKRSHCAPTQSVGTRAVASVARVECNGIRDELVPTLRVGTHRCFLPTWLLCRVGTAHLTIATLVY